MSPETKMLEASRAYIRSCVEATPLRGALRRLDDEMASDDVRESLIDGFEAFLGDLDRWQASFDQPHELFDTLRLATNLEATYFYRVSHQLWKREVKWVPDVFAAVSKQQTGTEFYYSADIGPGLKVIHGVGAVIGALSKIGSNFTIYQGATIGDKLGRDTGTGKRPLVGDQVILTVGAQIIGPVEIGSQTVIGANAVVLDSLPDRCVAAGVPARVVIADVSDAAFEEYWSSVGR